MYTDTVGLVFFFLDDIRLELQNNTDIVDQLNTLATLAVNVSSCVSFNRIRAVKTLEEMEKMAKELFLKNELFASMYQSLKSPCQLKLAWYRVQAQPMRLGFPPVTVVGTAPTTAVNFHREIWELHAQTSLWQCFCAVLYMPCLVCKEILWSSGIFSGLILSGNKFLCPLEVFVTELPSLRPPKGKDALLKKRQLNVLDDCKDLKMLHSYTAVSS